MSEEEGSAAARLAFRIEPADELLKELARSEGDRARGVGFGVAFDEIPLIVYAVEVSEVVSQGRKRYLSLVGAWRL